MVWGFLWRFALFGFMWAYASTWVAGFLMGLAGASAEAVHSVGQVVQVLALAFAAWLAYADAKTG